MNHIQEFELEVAKEIRNAIFKEPTMREVQLDHIQGDVDEQIRDEYEVPLPNPEDVEDTNYGSEII